MLSNWSRILKHATVISRHSRCLKMSLDKNNHISENEKESQELFFQSASNGNLNDMVRAVNALSDVTIHNAEGLTALMLAAQHGQSHIIPYLIKHGCDVNMLNFAGQTAYDLAVVSNQNHSANLLLSLTDQNTVSKQYFSLNYLDRVGDKRRDQRWVDELLKKESTRFILFKALKPYVVINESNSRHPREHYKLALFSVRDIPFVLYQDIQLVLLGLLDGNTEVQRSDTVRSKHGIGSGVGGRENDKIAYIAVNVNDLSPELTTKIKPDAQLLESLPLGALQFDDMHAGMYAEASSLLAWHDRYQFCPTCGHSTESADGGYKRVCQNDACRSKTGVHNTSYPRIDPSMIMLVVSPNRSRCLLAHGLRHPPQMWSCLAGYVEPGESIEDTCRREVLEESGVHVGQVTYHSSQPWPFPSTLMLGCLAYAETDQIKIDPEELHDARWFERDEVIKMLTFAHPDGLFIPPETAIAHHLVKAWVIQSSENGSS